MDIGSIIIGLFLFLMLICMIFLILYLNYLNYRRLNSDLCRTEEEYEKEKTKFEYLKDNLLYAKAEYLNTLEKEYEEAEQKHDILIQKYQDDLKDAETRLEEIKSSLNAGVQAQLREREKEENLQFYKLYASDIDLQDIEKLNNLKLTLHNPVILSKLIWNQYFMKQTTDMCNRIFGKEPKCGIYKITDLITKQCYIGQSVNIQDRMKQHIKAGLGIDASSTSKLYNAMKKDGVWSFTFELIEECKREELNAKEKQWIGMYQSDTFGLNTQKGNN